MIAMILVHPHIFWLSLGGLLLAAEMLGGNGYLLWSGVAAVITGLVVWLVPLDWAWQGAMFAALTLLAALAVVEVAGKARSGAKSQPTAILTSADNSWLAVDLFWKPPRSMVADICASATVPAR